MARQLGKDHNVRMTDKLAEFILGKIVKDANRGSFTAAFAQFLRFGIVGISNTVVSYAIYVAALSLFKWLGCFQNYGYIIAQIVMFVLSVAWSFYWNRRFVFSRSGDVQGSTLLALGKCYVSYAVTGLFLNSLLLVLWVGFLGASQYIAPLINLVVTVPVNFLLNKYWAFRSR